MISAIVGQTVQLSFAVGWIDGKDRAKKKATRVSAFGDLEEPIRSARWSHRQRPDDHAAKVHGQPQPHETYHAEALGSSGPD